MVCCCVPGCGTDSMECDPTITFHEIPSNETLASKWIKQVNSAVKSKWVPKTKDVFCSKHFVETDFKDNTDALKPHCVPTIFGHRFIGNIADIIEPNKEKQCTNSPLIVKVVNPLPRPIIKNVRSLASIQTYSNLTSQNKNFNPVSVTSSPIKKQKSPFILSNTSNPPVKNKNVPVSSGRSLQKPFITLTNSTGVLSKNQTTFQHSNKNVKVDQVNSSKSVTLDADTNQMNNSQTKLSMKRNLNSDTLKPPSKKREKINSDLIEISPNTFLKINPDIIKVNKKKTASGNTVLQFLMDQKLANSDCSDILPKIIHGPINKNDIMKDNRTETKSNSSYSLASFGQVADSEEKEKSNVVQHVVGHLVDTHDCNESCSLTNDIEMVDKSVNGEKLETFSEKIITPDGDEKVIENEKKSDTNASVLEKAPVLLTTKMPISHYFNDKPKFLLQLKQKNRQIAALKSKISSMQKKIDDLEDKCVVQERQLSYSFIKRLKSIRKNSAKGDPCATYILEQVRSYSNNSKMRWSDSTLAQCALWCRKAPYAYEYFKKAEFFKLPCLGTVKRFMKKHPDIDALKKIVPNAQVDDDSSSDFDFDESDAENKGSSENETDKTPKAVQTISSNYNETVTNEIAVDQEENSLNSDFKISENQSNLQTNSSEIVKNVDSNNIPLSMANTNMEIQEIMLPSGEIVQCYSSNISNNTDGQYIIIPNVSDPNAEQEYSVMQADSLPVILQNVDPAQQEQLIFIANNTNQIQCSETIVSS